MGTPVIRGSGPERRASAAAASAESPIVPSPNRAPPRARGRRSAPLAAVLAVLLPPVGVRLRALPRVGGEPAGGRAVGRAPGLPQPACASDRRPRRRRPSRLASAPADDPSATTPPSLRRLDRAGRAATARTSPPPAAEDAGAAEWTRAMSEGLAALDRGQFAEAQAAFARAEAARPGTAVRGGRLAARRGGPEGGERSPAIARGAKPRRPGRTGGAPSSSTMRP